jgi:hypothetical protein
MILSSLSLAGVANAEETYKRDCGCESGITGLIVDGKAQCWICSKESYPVITNNTNIAKFNVRGRSCKGGVSPQIAAINIPFFQELIRARTEENACWEPQDPGHQEALQNSEKSIAICASFL